MATTLLCPNEQWGALVQELLAARKSLRLRLRGSSMYPVIHNNDIAHIQPASSDEIGPGTVVFYMVNQRPIVHRVMRRRYVDGKLCFLICSDFSGKGYWVGAENIFGRVMAIERDGRTMSLQGWRGQVWGWAFSRLWRALSATKQKLIANCQR